MLICRDTIELITDGRERALPWWRRLGLRFHLTVCPHCRVYANQMNTTIEALARVEPEPATPPHDLLLDALRKHTRGQ